MDTAVRWPVQRQNLIAVVAASVFVLTIFWVVLIVQFTIQFPVLSLEGFTNENQLVSMPVVHSSPRCQTLFLSYRDGPQLAKKYEIREEIQSNCTELFSLLDEVIPRGHFNQALSRCSWAHPPYKYFPSTDSRFVAFVRLLNEMGIVFWLNHGSLLGAYRHGGGIPGDADMDIVIPVWLNEMFGEEVCDDARTALGPTLRRKNVDFADTIRSHASEMNGLTLCGRTRTEWLGIAPYYLLMKRQKCRTCQGTYAINARPYGGFRMIVDSLGVDVVVSILTQDTFFNGPLCQCDWQSETAVCFENSDVILRNEYGNFMTPNRVGSKPNPDWVWM